MYSIRAALWSNLHRGYVNNHSRSVKLKQYTPVYLSRLYCAATINRRELPTDVQIVVCGGGVIGSSVALHLMKDGWKDVVLLEQGSLTCGTTWHSVGLIGRLKSSSLTTAIAAYSRDLYKELEEEGLHTGWKECGALYLARTKDRLIAYTRYLQSAQLLGVTGEVISPAEVKELVPHLKTDDLEGAVWVPGDGVVSAPDAGMAMARKAKDLGAQIFDRTKVEMVETDNGYVKSVHTDRGKINCQVFVNCSGMQIRTKVEMVETDNGYVKSVHTDRGKINCQVFVNCSGMWARELGQLCDVPVKVPLHPCEHFYLVTKPIEGIDRMMPVIRDYDGYVYMREWGGGILGGGFEPVAKPIFHNGIPAQFEHQLLPEDWDHFQVLMDGMLHRMPVMGTAQVQQLVNGPESFTPDGKYIVGEAPEVQNYFVAAGMNSSGIQAAGGVGKYISEWITRDETSKDLWSLDIRRFVDLHNNKKFLRDRVKEIVGMHSSASPVSVFQTARHIKMPQSYTRMADAGGVFDQFGTYERAIYFQDAGENCGIVHKAYKTGRNIKMSSIYPRQESCGALFDQYGVCERAIYFEGNDDENPHFQHAYSEHELTKRGAFGKPNWFDNVKSEYWACREGVCLIDMSTFTKFELSSAGNEVVEFLEYVCSNEVDKPVGTIVHTGMQNKYGGYENDCSIIRTAENRYFMIGPTAQQTRSLAWINEHLPKDGSVQVNDVTSMYSAINVIGPKAPELLSELTDTSLEKADFMHMTCKEIDVGQASGIKAMRLTHSGEEGWILYIPSEYALHVYDSLMKAGKNYGIRNAGYYALRALRTEKFFAYWGTDLTPRSTPLECGREYRVKFDKPGFIGYEALQKQREEGIKKKLVQFLVEDHDLDEDTWPWGGEPIYRNGKYCGTTTSTAYGFTLDRHICLSYVRDIDEKTGRENIVTNDFILSKGAKYEINIAGEMFPLKANIYPPKLASAAIIIKPQSKHF